MIGDRSSKFLFSISAAFLLVVSAAQAGETAVLAPDTRSLTVSPERVAAAVEQAHAILWSKFIGDDRLIHDYVGELPGPEDCRLGRPDAIGWWSPIENGPMFTGTYLAAICERARRSKASTDHAQAPRLDTCWPAFDYDGKPAQTEDSYSRTIVAGSQCETADYTARSRTMTAADGRLRIRLDDKSYKDFQAEEYVVALTNLSKTEPTGIVSDFRSLKFSVHMPDSAKAVTVNVLRGSTCKSTDFVPEAFTIEPGKEQVLTTAWFKKVFDVAVRMRPFYLGDFYQLTDETGTGDDVWCAWQCDRPDLRAGFAIAFRRGAAAEESQTFKLGGIDANVSYQTEFYNGSNKTVKGSELEN